MMISHVLKSCLAVAALAISGCMDTSQGATEVGRPFQSATYNHWDVRGRFVTRDQLFQNVTQEDLTTLLSGKTFVGYEESDGQGSGYGALSVRVFSPDGTLPMCILSYKTGQPLSDAFGEKRWRSVSADNTNIGYRVHELEVVETDNSISYSTSQYDPTQGKIAFLGFYRPEVRDVRKGHLQNGIPVAVYTACPNFPSAESLGTFVNQNQTSWNYFELLQQDAGDRVIRPDLVTAFTPTPIATGDGQ